MKNNASMSAFHRRNIDHVLRIIHMFRVALVYTAS